MNRIHILALIHKRRYGKIIHLIKTESHLWSINDMNFFDSNCHYNKLVLYIWHYVDIYTKHRIYLNHDDYDTIRAKYNRFGDITDTMNAIEYSLFNNDFNDSSLNLLKFITNNRKKFPYTIFGKYTQVITRFGWNLDILKYIFSNDVSNLHKNSNLYTSELYDDMSYIFNDTKHVEQFKFLLSEKILDIAPQFNRKITYTRPTAINDALYVAYVLKNKIAKIHYDHNSDEFSILLSCALGNLQYVTNNVCCVLTSRKSEYAKWLIYYNIIQCSLYDINILRYVTLDGITSLFNDDDYKIRKIIKDSVYRAYRHNLDNAVLFFLNKFTWLHGTIMKFVDSSIDDYRVDLLKKIVKYIPGYEKSLSKKCKLPDDSTTMIHSSIHSIYYGYELIKYILSSHISCLFDINREVVIKILNDILTYNIDREYAMDYYNIINHICSDEIIDRFSLHDYIEQTQEKITNTINTLKKLILIYNL